MLLALIICHLSVFVAANPFHKYPFVFLLDVGNEELEKINSEQIRVSVPGGSVALRYPAIGNGNTIGHVRVTGIDFGTDLKANIVDGGPGYKYVVLVFIGNAGVPYNAVVTVQTVADTAFDRQNIETTVNSEGKSYQSEEYANNSAEDFSDAEVSSNAQSAAFIENSNAELMQSSSSVYSYAENEPMDEADNNENDNPKDEGDDAHDDNESAGNEMYSQELVKEDSEDQEEDEGVSDSEKYKDYIDREDDPNVQVKSIDTEDNDDDDDDDDDDDEDEEIDSKAEQYSPDDYSETKPQIVSTNMEAKYEDFKDHLNFGGNINEHEAYQKNSRPAYREDPLDYEYPDAERPSYDDDEANNGADKYKDVNNNYIDSDDSYAVAY